jgi:gag-polyprotein putative aspartyl protease
MTRLFTTTAVILALATPAFADVAGVGCKITDTQNSEMIYIFKYASHTGPNSGVAYEVAYSKNGHEVITPVGQKMPGWRWSYDPGKAAISLYPDDAPRWWISGSTSGTFLMHGNNVIGKGECKDLNAKAFEPAAPEAPAPVVAQSHPAAAPSTGNSVPLMITNGAMFAGVTVGDQPIVMQVDTGANISTIEESVASQLLSSGQATAAQDSQVTLADGTKHATHNIIIGTVTVAGRQAHNVAAGVVPNGSGMLLGLVPMNQISPTFTVDLAKSRILLGT